MTKTVQPEGNYYNKYATKNPIEKWLMRNFFKKASRLLKLADMPSSAKILEAGCGEGHFTRFLGKKFKNAEIEAFDISETVVNEAKAVCRGLPITFSTGDINCISAWDNTYDLVCAPEVLEHMDDPVKALRELERISSKYVLITVPNEPLWRIMNLARLKYVRDLGNTPGHVNHWNLHSFNRLVRANTQLVPVRKQRAIPWIQFLYEKKA